MKTLHGGLTISTKIISGKKEVVETLLNTINEQQYQVANNLFPFPKLRLTHFITWVVLPKQETPSGKQLPERILLLTSYSGRKKDHINELAAIGLPALHKVYQNCEGYPYHEIPSPKQMVRYLIKYGVRSTFYTGFQNISFDQVAKENQLRNAIQGFLDGLWSQKSRENDSPHQIRKEIQEFVKSKPELKWATKPFKKYTSNFIGLFGGLILLLIIFASAIILAIVHFFAASTVTLIGLCFIIGFIVSILFLLGWLRLNENIPQTKLEPATDERIYDIVSKEIHPIKNELTVVAPLKKGAIRPLFLAMTLWLVQRVRAFSYIPTVHTARWLQVDRGRRIIFIANFDNTSEGYAHDFVDSTKRTRNLNLIFGHASGFPATKYAVKGGGEDRKGYITGVRAHQKLSQVWYSTHKSLGVLNINNNRDIYEGLFKKLEPKEVASWLLKF